MLGEDGKVALVARYPAREPLGARASRMLACPRECMLGHSWFPVESGNWNGAPQPDSALPG